MSKESEGNMGQTSLQLEQERDSLDSWKEIAAYLNRNVRTVQRWEKREGLPIHRHVHERASSVSAYKKEIDAWQKQRSRVSDEITENQRELELVIERLRTRLLVKRMREALAIALEVHGLENVAASRPGTGRAEVRSVTGSRLAERNGFSAVG